MERGDFDFMASFQIVRGRVRKSRILGFDFGFQASHFDFVTEVSTLVVGRQLNEGWAFARPLAGTHY